MLAFGCCFLIITLFIAWKPNPCQIKEGFEECWAFCEQVIQFLFDSSFSGALSFPHSNAKDRRGVHHKRAREKMACSKMGCAIAFKHKLQICIVW